MKRILFLLWYFFATNGMKAQSKVMIGESEEIVYPLSDAINGGSSSSDSLAVIFGSKTIVGLGEATHGTLEFSQYKSRIFQFLVNHCGYRSIIFEGSTGAFSFLNDYVHYGIGNVDSLLRQQNYWMFYTEEIKSLIQWIKDFNVSKDPAEQVSVYGFDMQLPQPELWYISRRMSRLSFPAKKYFDDIMNRVIDDIRPERLSESMSDKSVFAKMREIIPPLVQWFAEYQTSLAKLLDKETLQLMNISLQNANAAVAIRTKDMHFRDSCMAVNVRQLQSITGGKAAIWAHNGHISMADTLVGYNKFRKPMGEWLRNEFGNNYYAVGFIFGQGSFLALEQKKSAKGVIFPHLRVTALPSGGADDLSHLFSNIKVKDFFVDLSRSTNATWRRFYRTNTIGAVYVKGKSPAYYITPGTAFSALVYVDYAHATSQIDKHLYRIVQ
jgi:erythromycin esterase